MRSQWGISSPGRGCQAAGGGARGAEGAGPVCEGWGTACEGVGRGLAGGAESGVWGTDEWAELEAQGQTSRAGAGEPGVESRASQDPAPSATQVRPSRRGGNLTLFYWKLLAVRHQGFIITSEVGSASDRPGFKFRLCRRLAAHGEILQNRIFNRIVTKIQCQALAHRTCSVSQYRHHHYYYLLATDLEEAGSMSLSLAPGPLFLALPLTGSWCQGALIKPLSLDKGQLAYVSVSSSVKRE